MAGEKDKRPPAHRRTGSQKKRGAGPFWLYGLHPVRAALANPRRKALRAVLSERAAAALGPALLRGITVQTVKPGTVANLLPAGAVHQGAALFCEPLGALDLEQILAPLPERPRLVAVLDQITDPHNEGAILRSAAAFGVAAVITQDRHGPPETGALAKAASGALDIVPRIVTVNIARALEELGRLGFWRIALTGDGDMPLAEAHAPGDMALVLGAEGRGLRRLVRERCDAAAFIPMHGIPTHGVMESLNVSNAAAIAFYQLSSG